ncbi:MAG: hypothetical protein AAGA55_10895, partial [Planctomycetota bacterium]
KLGTTYDSTRFEVKVRSEVDPVFGPAAYLTDNESHIEAVIDGVFGVDPDRVSALWTGFKLPGRDSEPVTIASTGAEMRGRSQLVVRFPSLLLLKILKSGGQSLDWGDSEIRVSLGSGHAATVDVRSFIAKGAPKPTKTMKVQLATDTIMLPANGTEGAVRVSFEVVGISELPNSGSGAINALKKKTHFAVQIVGARAAIEGAQSSVIRSVPGRLNTYVVLKSGVANLKLEGLAAGVPVKLIFVEPEGVAEIPDVEIKVNKAN